MSHIPENKLETDNKRIRSVYITSRYGVALRYAALCYSVL